MMRSRHDRVFRLVASTVTAAALAVPVAAAAGDGGRSARNRSSEYSNPILRNDIAHYGSDRMVSSPATSSVQRQSPVPVVVRVEGGFDWAAGGIGAVGGIGLVLVAGAATSALRRRRRVDMAHVSGSAQGV